MNYKDYSNGLIQTQSLQLDRYFPHLYKWETTSSNDIDIQPSQRLGHLAEAIFFNVLEQNLQDQDQLLTNIQVIDNKVTLGELDALLVSNNTVHHLEFCYKVYLYDPALSLDEFDCWVGPNRRDSLKQKVEKMKQKQLPLFFNETTTELLEKKIKNFSNLTKQQSVCFLGQLYVPLTSFENRDSFNFGRVDGFYIHFNDLNHYSDREWFVPPSKAEWLLSPIPDVNWISTNELRNMLNEHYSRSSNPLCWVKTEDGTLNKCFVVNWEQP